MRPWTTLTALLVLTGLCASGPAQAAQLTGRVLDENNAPLSGAEVLLRSAQGDHRVFSDPAGAFQLTLAELGDYSVKVGLPGYFDLRDRSIQITAGSNELTLVLTRIRDSLESLDVSGASSIIDLDKTVRDQRLSSAELLEIPYRNNNDLRNAMRVLPSVVQDQNGGIHVNGAAEQNILYTIDSFNITDPLTGTFQSRLSVEAVQSMSVLSGAVPAEYGKAGAGVLAVNTKTGGDQLLYSATNFLPGVEYRQGLIIGSWTPRFNFSGPIRKGKAWFSDSFGLQYAQDVVRDLPPGQNRSTNWRYSNMFTTQVNLTQSNILHAGFLVNYWISPYSGLSALDPRETTVNRRASQYFYDVKDQIYLGRGSLVEVGYASNRTFGREIPQGSEPYIYGPLGRSGNYFADGDQRSSRNQWIANYFLPSFQFLGGHQIKSGVDLDDLSYWQNIRRTGIDYYRADNTRARQVTFVGSGLLGRSNFESSAYLQDSWRVRPGLLVDIGVRADRDNLIRNWNVAPRVGFAWSPFGRENTKISGGYGVLYNASNLILFTRPRDQFAITTFYPESGGDPYSLISTYAIDRRHLQTPRYQNMSVGWEQRYPGGLFTSIQAIARRGRHGLSYFDATSLTPVVTYNLQDERRDDYNALEFTVRHNIKRQYQWLASYTRSAARSNAVIDLNTDDPLLVGNNSGRLPWDAPNRLISWGFLPTFWAKWSLSYLAEWHSGFPFSVRDERGVIVGPVSADRFPEYLDVDVAIERQLDLRGQRWAWRMGLNNLTNHRNYDTVNNQLDSPTFMHFYGGQGRAVGFRVRWLGKL